MLDRNKFYMATNREPIECIAGYITNISGENKKKKFFVRFTMVSENNQTIDGWVFSGKTGIAQTKLGTLLSKSVTNKTAVKLWGNIEHTNG